MSPELFSTTIIGCAVAIGSIWGFVKLVMDSRDRKGQKEKEDASAKMAADLSSLKTDIAILKKTDESMSGEIRRLTDRIDENDQKRSENIAKLHDKMDKINHDLVYMIDGLKNLIVEKMK